MFSRLPATRRGCRPICSTAPASSVTAVFASLQRLHQQAAAEHLRRLRQPELAAVLGAGDAHARRLHPWPPSSRCRPRAARGCRRSGPRASRAIRLVEIALRQAGPRRIVHQHPVVRVHRRHRRHHAVVHRIAPRLAAAVERFQLARERAPVVSRELPVVRREHHEHVLAPAPRTPRPPRATASACRRAADTASGSLPEAAFRCRRRESARRTPIRKSFVFSSTV